MSELNPTFALQGDDGQPWSLRTERLSLHAIDDIRILRLQVRPGAGTDPAPLEKLLGSPLPNESAGEGARQSPEESVNNGPTAYWLAPNDWLLVNPAPDIGGISGVLRDAAGGATAVVTDMSDAWSIIDISGEDARARLAEGCSVDLDDNEFPAGRHALTRLQHLPVIIHRLDDTPRFRILVDRSVAQFLRDWLL